MFITFNTRKQAENYVKRHKQACYSYNEPCGCCGKSLRYYINGNKVLKSNFSITTGIPKRIVSVIGKIKRERLS